MSSNWNTVALLQIGDQALSLGQILQYYQLSGKLLPWIRDIVEQHILFQELQRRSELSLSAAEVEQIILNFRVNQNLTDATAFQSWLQQQGMTYELFQARLIFSQQLAKLKTQITEAELQPTCETQKPLLDQVEVLGAVVSDRSLAEQLKSEVHHAYPLDRVAQDYAQRQPEQVTFLHRTFRYGQLPTEVRDTLRSAQPGWLLDPLELEGKWCVLRIERQTEAVLDEAMQQILRNQIFQQWLNQQVQNLTVNLTVPQAAAQPSDSALGSESTPESEAIVALAA
ncbi:MAG: hypothetical protein VKJ24_15170 [Synechococcales bacterium]|nr:hypothetical protein [Synechococcales bacterium]